MLSLEHNSVITPGALTVSWLLYRSKEISLPARAAQDPAHKLLVAAFPGSLESGRELQAKG